MLDAGMVDAGPPPPAREAAAPLIQWVDPFIGTGGEGFSVGSAFPGPQVPFGMVRPSPDTTLDMGAAGFYHCSGYYYGDDFIWGFSHTRMHGTGITDYGHIALMPTIGMTATKTTQEGMMAPFSHDTEEASPGYYAVTLADSDIRVELSASARVALHRYTFPAGSDATVLVDVGHHPEGDTVIGGEVTVDPTTREVSGWSHLSGGYSGRHGGERIYFVARFTRPWLSHGTWRDGTMSEGSSTSDGTAAGAFLHFDATTDAEVEAAVGISWVDVAHARMNLDAEGVPHDFDGTRAAAEAEWEEALGRVRIEGRSDDFFAIFYTALYHTLLMPTLAEDVDGSYRGFDQMVHVADTYTYYTDFSLWDTFRTEHPWLTLVYPEYQTDFLRSLIQQGQDGGYIDRWPLGTGYTGGMIGESATVTFADSWVKGVRDYDLRAAYDLMRRTAMEAVPAGAPYGGREGLADYLELGYVSSDHGGSVSITQEYAYDDFALAILADALGETADAEMFRARSRNWINVLDLEQRFALARARDGTFTTDFSPWVWEEMYVEGNAWQWLWYAPHDLDAFAEAWGGREAVFETLDMFFRQSERTPRGLGPDRWYWQGNEIDLHVPWMYTALDSPDRTARWTRWVLATRYGLGAGGLPGNDDAGTMSAWYLFAALGLYAIAGTDYYLVGSPLVTRATLHLAGGDLIIEAPDASEHALYVTGATLDGAPLDRARITHAELADGATLRFEMSSIPARWAER